MLVPPALRALHLWGFGGVFSLLLRQGMGGGLSPPATRAPHVLLLRKYFFLSPGLRTRVAPRRFLSLSLLLVCLRASLLASGMGSLVNPVRSKGLRGVERTRVPPPIELGTHPPRRYAS